MTLAPQWRTRFFAVGAAAIAIWLGIAIAQEDFFWPSITAGVLLLFLLARCQPLPLGTLLLGGAIIGYIVGNRGFAQVTLMSSFPLLPAETVLLLGGGILLAQSAWRHELPFRRGPLNVILLTWIAVGTIRVGFDFREFGFVALRDFAVVYYAAFFYLAEEAARDARAGRFLQNVVLASSVVLLGVYCIYDNIPEFFLNHFTFRGMPLIFYKGDLVGTFLAVGSVLFFLRFEEKKRWWNLVLSLALAGAVLATDNRASLLGLGAATAWLAIGGRWKFAAVQAAAGVGAATTILLFATAMNIPWDRTPLFGVYEMAVSIADPSGSQHYRGSETFNKGDNNLFRTVWWQAVIDETIEGNPYVGLGFGHDLADRFVREYYPENSEEFSTRSPHNVLVTIFARMGAAGLAVFLAAMAVIAVRTWRAVRAGPREAAPWCAVWVMFMSACFGVVLEGPMGAVVFWTMLGVAYASSTAPKDSPSPEVLATPAATNEEAVTIS